MPWADGFGCRGEPQHAPLCQHGAADKGVRAGAALLVLLAGAALLVLPGLLLAVDKNKVTSNNR
eukprot:363951-Chlamydomonas_euryale.AAC.5